MPPLPKFSISQDRRIMGCCRIAQEDAEEQEKRSRAIDRVLEKDAERLRRERKVLLLGMGNSGKSTIVKQMKIIHQGGYSTQELAMYRSTIYRNVLQCAKDVVRAMREFEIEVENPENKGFCNHIMEYELDSNPDVPLEHTIGDAITAIWNDSCMAKVFERENEYYDLDSAPYFFGEVKRITAPDYLPTESDVLRSRSRRITRGICETTFSMDEIRIRLFDIGHMPGERKKWIHCFENVTSIMYLVPLSEYDRILSGAGNEPLLMEALVLFESIVNSRLFQRTSIILFLNKIDVFKTKLSRAPFRNYFPDYSGGNDVSGAAKYLLGRFDQLNRAHLFLYPQYVNMGKSDVQMDPDLLSQPNTSHGYV